MFLRADVFSDCLKLKKNGFVLQDGPDYVFEVSVVGYPAVPRRQDGTKRGAAAETSGGERCSLHQGFKCSTFSSRQTSPV